MQAPPPPNEALELNVVDLIAASESGTARRRRGPRGGADRRAYGRAAARDRAAYRERAQRLRADRGLPRRSVGGHAAAGDRHSRDRDGSCSSRRARSFPALPGRSRCCCSSWAWVRLLPAEAALAFVVLAVLLILLELVLPTGGVLGAGAALALAFAIGIGIGQGSTDLTIARLLVIVLAVVGRDRAAARRLPRLLRRALLGAQRSPRDGPRRTRRNEVRRGSGVERRRRQAVARTQDLGGRDLAAVRAHAADGQHAADHGDARRPRVRGVRLQQPCRSAPRARRARARGRRAAPASRRAPRSRPARDHSRARG